MNQIVATRPNGGKMVILVLEPGNLQKLKQDMPITIHIEDLFPDGIPKKLDVIIAHSETPVADHRALAKLAEVTFDERSAHQVRPHCPECRSTIEQLGVWRNESPLSLVYCPACGCVFGALDATVTKSLVSHDAPV